MSCWPPRVRELPCPERLRLDVIDSAKECPGACIHVERETDGVEVAGPEA